MARLLHARLFGSEQERKDLEEEVKSTVLFQRHREQVEAVMNFENPDLLAWVRRRFQAFGVARNENVSKQYQDFVQSVVEPCLQAQGPIKLLGLSWDILG